MASRKHTGTNIRREIDMAALSRSLRAEGIDPRHWLSYGTVGTFDGESGEPDFADSAAVWVGPEGCEVDVVLEPSGIPATCKYAGIAGGNVAVMMAPIVPGDIVLVGLVDGHVPTILGVLNSASVPIPLEQDGKPVFRNDRVSMFARQVPIEIRTEGGARAVLAQDGSVNLNQGDNGVARLHDAVQTTMSPDEVTKLAASMVAAGLVLPGVPTGNPPAPVVLHNGQITSASGTVKAGG